MNLDLTKCYCEGAGFCQIYKKQMDAAGVKWCSHTDKEKRENYCELNNPKQKKLIDSLSQLNVICLGHCRDQFKSINKKQYLTFQYLQDLDLKRFSKFQTNQYAENRAYLADIFDYEKYNYIGVVTASWNIKYNNKNKIDELEKWLNFNYLDRKNTVICATTASTISWIQGSDSVMKWLGTPKKHINEIIKFHEKLGMKINSKEVANHNQIICHKDLFKDIQDYFKENIFEYSKLFDGFNLSEFSEFARSRLFAFYCEFSSMMFLSNNLTHSLPMQKCNAQEWFQPSEVKKRNDGIYNKNIK